MTAEVFIVPPIAHPLDMVVQLAPDTPEVRAAVEAEVRDLLMRDSEPGG